MGIQNWAEQFSGGCVVARSRIPGSRPGAMLVDMRIVWRPQNLLAGQIGKQLLLAHGVPCHLAGEHLSGGLGELPAFGLYALMVEPERFEEADRLLRENGLIDAAGEFEA
jgi:hypothetical protein